MDVRDVAEAVATAALTPSRLPSLLNLGSGRAALLRDLARTMLAVAGTEQSLSGEWRPARCARSDVAWQQADITLARRALDWLPSYDLGTSLRDMWLEAPCPPDRPTALAVPAYFHPAVAAADWAVLAQPHRGLRAVILNVADGPGTPSTRAVRGRCRGPVGGHAVLGYVDTGYGDRPVASILAELRRYRSWYGTSGFFFDQRRLGRDAPAALPRAHPAAAGRGRPGGAQSAACTPARPTPISPTRLVTFEGPWSAYEAATVSGLGVARALGAVLAPVYDAPASALDRRSRWPPSATPARSTSPTATARTPGTASLNLGHSWRCWQVITDARSGGCGDVPRTGGAVTFHARRRGDAPRTRRRGDAPRAGVHLAGTGWLLIVLALGGCPRRVRQHRAHRSTAAGRCARLACALGPRPGTAWQWQLTTPVDTRVDVHVYDIDGFENSAAVVTRCTAKGRRVICYVNVGAAENFRPDRNRFPAELLGAPERLARRALAGHPPPGRCSRRSSPRGSTCAGPRASTRSSPTM